MELIEMNLTNYRRLFEDTNIKFARGEKNVTIIRAQNGSGKTGILMSLLFGLFGTVKYEQFQIEEDNDVMVSSYLLTEGKQATCTVKVKFIEDKDEYQIERSICAKNTNGVITQANENIKTILYKNGLDTKWSKTEIDSFMNSLVGENIRGFLFFDGVKYTELFKRNDGAASREIKEIIEKMLNINDLDKTIETIRALKEGLSQNGKKSKVDVKLAEVKNKIDNEKNTFDEIIKSIKAKKDSLKEAEKKESEVLSKLASLSKYQSLIEEMNTNRKNLGDVNTKINTNVAFAKDCGKTAITNGLYSTFGLDVKSELNKYSVDAKGGIELIDYILNRGQCICHNEKLTKEEIQNLNNYKAELQKTNVYPIKVTSKLKEDAYAIENSKNSNSFSTVLSNAINYAKEVSDLEKSYQTLLSKIDDKDIKEIGNISNELHSSEANKIYLQGYKKRIDGEIDELEKNRKESEERLKSLDQDKETLLAEKAIENGEINKLNFYSGAEQKLVELKKQYLNEAKTNISDKANDYFIDLISKSDKSLVKKLELDSSYSIKVYDKHNREIFRQLSAGQKQMASMAFVMGLTAVASNAKPTCNFPLVMDTPMSNLDSLNRESLIKLMPTAVKQWILTPMDTELSDTEVNIFDRTNKVGSVYQLLKNGISSKLIKYDSMKDLLGGIEHE